MTGGLIGLAMLMLACRAVYIALGCRIGSVTGSSAGTGGSGLGCAAADVP